MTVLMTRRAHGALVVCGLCLALLLLGCREDEESISSQGSPSSSTSTARPTTASASASPSGEASFEAEELRAYDAALEFWSTYERESEPIWAEGRATKDAEALFKRYFVSPVWKRFMNRLRTYEGADVKVIGLPTVLWSKAADIHIESNQGSVTITQCVDYASQVVRQAGKSIDPIPAPVLRQATLDQTGTSGWLLLRIDEPSIAKYRACSEVGP